EAPFIGDFESRNVFKADVTGLKANTFYKYRMGTEGAWSEVFYHQTSRGSAAGFSFTVVADPQSSYSSYNTDNLNGHTEEEMYKVLDAANKFDSDNRFFLMLGDIVDEIGKRPNEVVSYTGIANKFNKERPIIATQGNHDTYRTTGDNVYVFGEATVFNAFVTFPDNGWEKPANPNRSQPYYFYYNKVLVVVLNTMATTDTNYGTSPNHDAQAAWLKDVLQKDKDDKASNYRIVVTHISPFGGRTSERGYQPEVRAAYGKICTDFNVDIFFAGHDHVYGRSNPIKIDSSTSISSLKPQFAAGTAGGVIYSVASTAGPKYYNLDPSPDRDEYFPGERQKFGGPDQAPGMFINVKVTSSYLTVKAVHGGSGAVIDEYNVPIKK
ncbi:MAG: metallophosphoesterase, partial [Treponema sp.]|nr:metallophosphoesterase [Treponema sp.]